MPGGWVGQAGAPVQASLRVRATGRAEPAAIDLLADGSPVASLPRTGAGTYQGTWVPAAGMAGPAWLAAVAARATADEVASAPLGVRVDVEPPALSGATAACAAAPCLRDAGLRVGATAADANLVSVEASLDLDPARAFPMALSGAEWVADVDLGALPFPALARDVAVQVRAVDAAGNATVQSLALAVTRLRWAYDAGAPVTSPAVMADGTLVVGVLATSDQLRAVAADGTEVWKLSVGSGLVQGEPSLGANAIYVGTSGNRVYAVSLDGVSILNGTGCDTGGNVAGSPAVWSSPEYAIAASASGRLYATTTGSTCTPSSLTDTFSASPSIDRSGKVLAATATATATLRKYSFDGAFTPDWSVQVGVNVGAPIAIDAAGAAFTGSQDAKLNLTTPAGSTATVKTLGGSIVDSPVILAGGDVVVGDQARVLHRFRPDGTQVWAGEPVLDGPVLAPLVLAGGGVALLVPTAAGTIHALAADGTVLWGGALTPGQALRAGNLHTPAGAAFGTAYFGSADGKLYAVAVEGRLDEAAPWPKAHHDSRNTSNAASPLP
jgi:hypothetical protein